jgi:hypothetical protein
MRAAHHSDGGSGVNGKGAPFRKLGNDWNEQRQTAIDIAAALH